MEQTKALNALEPFLALSKTATSPIAGADLITRATSAPNTFLFTELLETPAIQSLNSSPDFAPYFALLQIFSYGTYATYRTTPGLPPLAAPQAQKLRQLSLLTLARDRKNLSYSALQNALDLPDARDLEALVISAVYAGLLHATLDPARAAVQVTSVAPLRDLHPGAIPDMITSLSNWSDRCTSTLADLEAQMKEIRTNAAERQLNQRVADIELQELMAAAQENRTGPTRDMIARRTLNKRSVKDVGNLMDTESMELDPPEERSNKRKM
ncbi:hypothetical protein B0T10DRAFT_86107 [Thelonectria olida]|uniref:PCI domain-containing protein n=1 Tax=Thelonectria olida TaxID=1576542 RepID=A0A9P9AM66_9HYPO|nr:hypothetical protein B0T10DRAFT_86107 [Thelonectria olida]